MRSCLIVLSRPLFDGHISNIVRTSRNNGAAKQISLIENDCMVVS